MQSIVFNMTFKHNNEGHLTKVFDGIVLFIYSIVDIKSIMKPKLTADSSMFYSKRHCEAFVNGTKLPLF